MNSILANKFTGEESTLLRRGAEAEERAAMERGRILASKSWSLESSHSANRVSILSRSSSFSSSDFPESADDHALPPEVDCSAIFSGGVWWWSVAEENKCKV